MTALPAPRRALEDIDHDLHVHVWMRDQAIVMLRMDDATREQRWIDTLLDERLTAGG